MWLKYIRNGAGSSDNPVLLRRVAIVNSFSLIGIVFLFFFGFVNILNKDILAGNFEIAISLLALLNIIMLRKTQNIEKASAFMLCLMLLLTGFLLLSGGMADTGLFWLYTFPPLAYALKGKTKGHLWIGISLFMIITIIILEVTFIIANPFISYSPLVFRQFLASYICVSLIAYLYAYFQEQADASLEREKNLLQTILDNLPVGVQVSKPNSPKPFMQNHTASLLVGKSVFKQDGSAYPSEEMPLKLALQSRKKIIKDDMLTRTAGDKNRYIRGISTPVFGQNGSILFAVGVFEDITHEKEVDKMKSEFISIASHQLLTPLTEIKAEAELFMLGDKYSSLGQDQKKIIESIKDINTRMIDLVTSLLDISRLESGRIQINPQLTSIDTLIQEALADVKEKLKEKKQELELKIPKNIPQINIDPSLTRQIYLNLLTNASKYTPAKGKISLSIEDKGDVIFSKITDNGYGIPEKDQDKVFQKFYRGENIRSIISEGTGLGLYLIKEIVKVSKGEIDFESQEGKGTAFWFTLPKK